MPRPKRDPKKPAEEGEEPEFMGKPIPTAGDDWMSDEEEDPMEDDSLEIDEEES